MDERIFCPQCRLHQPADHVYCVRCGSDLPGHLLPQPAKTARFFAGVKVSDDDPEGAFLRVSCYLRDQVFEAPEGSVRVPGEHVRFSVWVRNEARCVLSLPAGEARALAQYITHELAKLQAAQA